MIEVYQNSASLDLSKNGIILNPITCTVENKLNDTNELELEYPLMDDKYKYLINNNFIVIKLPDFKEKQIYRIYDTKKNMDTIIVNARHIAFDLSKKIIFNKSITGNAQTVLNGILQGTNFTGTTNITSTNTGEYKLKSVMACINGEDNCFVNLFGGEISCNNYNLSINNSIGQDRGIRISFGYNLEDIEEELNFDEVVTRIYPSAGDLVLSSNTPYVDSPLISKLGIIEDTVDFSDIKVKDSDSTSDTDEDYYSTTADAEAEMIRRCNNLFTTGTDKIKANYTVKLQDLSKTIEYKQLGYDVLEKICLGDKVHCYNKNIDIEVSARCISYKWDCIQQEYEEIELGDYLDSYTDKIIKKEKQTSKAIEEAKDDIEEAKEETAGLKVVMEKRDSEIELSVTNETEQRKTAIMVMDGKIDERVTNSEFESYKTQTADEIDQKVSKGNDFSSEMKQNVNTFQFLFHGASDGQTTIDSNGITVKCGGFKVVDSSGNTVLKFDSDGTCITQYLSAKNLNCTNTDKGSSFYHMLYNMEEANFKNLNATKLFVSGNHIYDYIVGVLEDKGLI